MSNEINDNYIERYISAKLEVLDYDLRIGKLDKIYFDLVDILEEDKRIENWLFLNQPNYLNKLCDLFDCLKKAEKICDLFESLKKAEKIKEDLVRGDKCK